MHAPLFSRDTQEYSVTAVIKKFASKALCSAVCALSLALAMGDAAAEPALSVLGKDYAFPNRIEGFPARLSDFKGLQINTFQTNDGVKLSYWEAGRGRPLIFIPGWSANGAEYINVMYLLSRHYRVIVLDPRNQGLSQRVEYGGRIERFSMDLRQLVEHLGVQQADFCGWSMGASVLWGYIDLFGTQSVRKACFVDEPISIYSHADWSEQERVEAGGTTTSAERMVAGMTRGEPINGLVTDMKPWARYQLKDSPYFANSHAFSNEFIKNDPRAIGRVLFDHVMNDWRDVIRYKINVPVAIFSGEESNNLPSQRWAASVIPNAKLYSYNSAEQGDHFLMFKNPVKFTNDLRNFLEQ
jgi:pimeloyl-ACP methyl ester carboxylesterase